MSKRRELEEQRAAQERKQWITIGAIIAGIAVVVIGGAVILSNATGNTAAKPSGIVLPPVKTAAIKLPANIQANTRIWGPADAPIKIVEYLDYQCPACGSFHKNFEQQVIDAFAPTGKVSYEARPIPFLDRGQTNESRDTAQGSYCAAEQNKFWDYHETIFANQPITGDENIGNFSKARLKEMFATIPGVDAAKFGTCLDNDVNKDKVAADAAEASARPVNQTPSFLVNGKLIAGDNRIATIDGWKQIFAEVAPDVKLP